MANRSRKGTIVCVLVAYLLNFAGYAHGAGKDITIAILPCKDVVMTFKKFHPLVTYLKQETGLDIKLVVPENSAEFERDLKNGDIDFAFQDSYTYVRLADLYNKGTLLRALTRDGETVQCGVVITRKDSGINKVEDLKGKTVMFGPKLSATNWVLAKLLFEEKGIDIDKNLRAYSNGMCCEDIAFNVYLKMVDAGVVCDHFFEEHSERQQELGIDAKEIIIVGKTRLIPTNVFAANRSVTEEIIMMINAALLSLEKEKGDRKKLLDPAQLGGFEKASDEDFNGMRMLINKMNDAPGGPVMDKL
jgi:phosphonate transport system substrate-binding protein